ncbi:MAG: hypothetical protein R2874_14960 [Desulfobacterales bacterium]
MASKYKGYAGKVLDINLTTGTTGSILCPTRTGKNFWRTVYQHQNIVG